MRYFKAVTRSGAVYTNLDLGQSAIRYDSLSGNWEVFRSPRLHSVTREQVESYLSGGKPLMDILLAADAVEVPRIGDRLFVYGGQGNWRFSTEIVSVVTFGEIDG